MAKQRIRPLLLLKKNSAVMQRVANHTFALQNKLTAIGGSGGGGSLRAVAGWTGLQSCAVAVAAVTHLGAPVTSGGIPVTHT